MGKIDNIAGIGIDEYTNSSHEPLMVDKMEGLAKNSWAIYLPHKAGAKEAARFVTHSAASDADEPPPIRKWQREDGLLVGFRLQLFA